MNDVPYSLCLYDWDRAMKAVPVLQVYQIIIRGHIMMRWWIIFVLIFLLGIGAAAQNVPPYPGWLATWDGYSRFTMLVMGIDRRPDDTSRTYLDDVRADTIMLVSYDPATQQIGILGIPRDLYFSRSDNGTLTRVNSLLVYGEQRQPGYGPYFTLETLQNNLGIYIDAYVAFDFEAFITLVDVLGGITIEVQYTINDPSFPDLYYNYDPLYLTPGTYLFSGYDALRYARTRHGDSDYLRVQRQLQVVQAIRDQLRDEKILARMVAQSPLLFAQLENNIYTNIPLEHALALGLAVAAIDNANIHTGSIDQSYSYNYNTGTAVVRVPDRNRLAELLTEVFGTTYGG